jgi:lipopolysaccharide export system protein LptA
MLNKHNKHLALLLPFLLWASSTWALTEDTKKPVSISANSVVFNKAKGYAVYEGNVSIKQGTLEISAWKIELFAPGNEIQRIEASGSPVIFKQRMDDGKLAQGKGKKMRYLVKEKRLILTGEAELSQDKDRFSSNQIQYSLRTGELTAGNNKRTDKNQPTGRVRAIFYPTNK